jgi:predicted ABC-type ATPase
MTSPTLYIVAGPNGIGKTTAFFDVVPRDIPAINSDEISAEIRRRGDAPANTQELANAELYPNVRIASLCQHPFRARL